MPLLNILKFYVINFLLYILKIINFLCKNKKRLIKNMGLTSCVPVVFMEIPNEVIHITIQ